LDNIISQEHSSCNKGSTNSGEFEEGGVNNKVLRKKKMRSNVIMCEVDDCLCFFSNPDELKRHIGEEHLAGNFVCNFEDCGKKYLLEENLTKHKKTHFPIKKLFKCDFPGCPKSFTASYNMRVTILTNF
jgi:hypothetical protein